MTDNEEIRDVMQEEQQRGRRRPKDAQARRERRRILLGLRALYDLDEKRFREALLAYDVKEGTEQFETALKLWREKRKA